jgi:disulfide bond formation protein DsbB
LFSEILVTSMLHNTIGRLGERAAAIGLICASIVALASAYAFQFLGGLQPCALCLYQRIPWWVALGLGALSLRLYATVWMRNLMVWSGAAAVLAGAGIAGYHAGVEYKWWAGPATCSGIGGAAQTLDALRDQIMNAAVVRCDEIPWSLFGVSMAGYNFLLSLFVGLGTIWIARR